LGAFDASTAPHREVLLVFSLDFALPSSIILRVSSMFALGIIFSYTRLPFVFETQEPIEVKKGFERFFFSLFSSPFLHANVKTKSFGKI
jgi:hypothetical protein